MYTVSSDFMGQIINVTSLLGQNVLIIKIQDVLNIKAPLFKVLYGMCSYSASFSQSHVVGSSYNKQLIIKVGIINIISSQFCIIKINIET